MTVKTDELVALNKIYKIEFKCCLYYTTLHRRNPTASRHRCAQRCDSDGADSDVTALTVTALDISGYDTDVTAMFTLV